MAINNTILGEAQTIRDETANGANSALRVGTCLVNIVNEFGTYMQTSELGPALGASYASIDGNELVTWYESRVCFLKTMGETYDGPGYTPVMSGGDVAFSPAGLIYYDFDNTTTIYAPKQKVLYINMYTGKFYHWNGSSMVQLG